MDIAHVFVHSLEDSAKMLPFLFAAYLLIEYVERKKSDSMQRLLSRGGRWGFVPGAVLGIVPQCGFSAMAANFYASRVITLGTLMAVFLSTSDEAIPIMLAQPESYGWLAALVGVKLAYALLVGFVLDVALVHVIPERLRGGWGGKAAEVDCHSHDEQDNIFWAAAKHTLNIFITIFAFVFAFGLLVEALGEGEISAFLSGLGFLQPPVAAAIGMIPNCASSVLLTQLFLSGGITFGSVVAGLCCNAGVGLAVLFRANKNMRQNFFVLGLLYFLGVLPGIVLHLLGI